MDDIPFGFCTCLKSKYNIVDDAFWDFSLVQYIPTYFIKFSHYNPSMFLTIQFRGHNLLFQAMITWCTFRIQHFLTTQLLKRV